MATNPTSDFFTPGKLGILLDAQHGSSGKGKIASYLVKHAAGACQFLCNTFMPQASHVVVEGGKSYTYKQLNSAAHLHHLFEKMYIGQGSVIDVEVLLAEIAMVGLPVEKLGISPLATILQPLDTTYEKGETGFDGEPSATHDGTIKYGSTCSGVGAARARRILRRPNGKVARDIEALQPYLCDVSVEIMDRLDKGQAGLLELAQGFPLSYGLPHMFPYTTSRNVTVAAGLDDLMVPPVYAGNVLLNLRTFPIRIHSFKYLSKEQEEVISETTERVVRECYDGDGHGENLAKVADFYAAKLERSHDSELPIRWRQTNDPSKEPGLVFYRLLPAGRHLTWDEVQSGTVPHQKIPSYSGDFYPDQREMTWEELTEQAQSPVPIRETTTLTKLPRRVATFSQMGLLEAIRYNRTTGGRIFLSLNFCNYVDVHMTGVRDFITPLLRVFLNRNIDPVLARTSGVTLRFLGTGAETDDFVQLAASGTV